jgi:hypothetical protein
MRFWYDVKEKVLRVLVKESERFLKKGVVVVMGYGMFDSSAGRFLLRR